MNVVGTWYTASVIVLLVFGPVFAQADAAASPTTQPASGDKGGQEDAWQPGLPDEYVWMTEPPISELKVRLSPLTSEQLQERADQALAAVQIVASQLADELVRHMQMMADGQAQPDVVLAVERRLDKLVQFRQDIITRTNVVFAELEAKGGDVAGARAYVKVIEGLEPEHRKSEEAESLSEEDEAARRLADRVAAAVAKVREMPPVHERPKPWTVSVRELELELQPLQKEQIDERVQKWLDILQRELRQRIRLDIALMQTEDDAERQALADQSAAQQEIVQAIVERVKAMLVILQKRGGETSEYQDYIANATGQRLNLTNPGVLMAQTKSWLRSRTGGVKVGLGILQFVGILAGFWIASRIIGRMVTSAVKRMPKSSELLRKFVGDLVRWTIMIVGLAVAVNALGVTVGPMIAAIGAAGLVIGLALQGTLSNFASGILILVTRPFDVGDVISAGGVFGKVDAMNLVSTRVLTFDNQVMLVPNNQIWNGVITNLTALKTRRVDLTFGIAYSADMAKAQAALEDVLKSHPKVLAEPAPMIKVHELADSSVNFIARPWVKTEDYWDVHWDLTRQVKERFDAEGIGIPFPQRDVHLYTQTPANGSDAARPSLTSGR
jgi:small conductance mechanosensitive channel